MSVVVPTSLAEALAAVAARPHALILAGGTDVMVEMNSGHRRVSDVIAINRVPQLRSWRFDPAASTVTIGAAITYAQLVEMPFAEWVPALAQAARTVGSPQIRNAATIGGNVATSSPAGDGLPVLAALDAVVHLQTATGHRDVDFADFMVGPKRTARLDGEMITAVTVPVLQGWQGYAKVGVRNAMVISNAGACLAVDEPARSVRLALGSVGPTIIRCTAAEQFAGSVVDFAGRQVSAADEAEFGELAAAAARPIDDHRSTAQYRRHAIGVLSRRLLRRAFPNA
jgi:CO/xanthine dehydrogenase FAD-binding subunit